MPARMLPGSERARTIALGAVAAVALLVITQLVLPGSPGSSTRGTPASTLFEGAVSGAVNALTAVAIVLVYRTLRIINFAQTALGAAGALLCFELVQFTAVPFPLALVLGLALATGVGVGVGVVTLRFFNASRLVLTVVTIVGAAALLPISDYVRRLPFFKPENERTIEETFGIDSIRGFLPLPGFEFQVGSRPQQFGFSEVFALELAVLLLVGVALFLRYTRAGVAVRALAENAERASLLGISVAALSCTVWGIAGLLGGASQILTGILVIPAAGTGGIGAGVLLTGLAAAVLGRMERIGVTAAASVGIAVLSAAFGVSFPSDLGLIPVALFVVIAAGLLLQSRQTGRSERGGGVSWSATDEQRPVPKELLAVPSVRLARIGIAVAGLVTLVAVPFFTSVGVQFLGSTIALTTIVVLSIVVLTGWAGQVSLGQFGFAAIGAVVGAALTARVGLTFWLAVPIASAVTAAFAAVVGLPALRIKGLFLLVVTFSFAVAVESALFDERYFGWILASEGIERPTAFLVDFNDERSMYFLSVTCLVVAIVVVTNLRRSRTGRVLIALRENDANVAAFGIAPVRTKLLAFAIAGGLCGFAGSVFVHLQRGLDVESFAAGASVNAFVQAVFGGVGSVAGALLGVVVVRGATYFLTSPVIQDIVLTGGPLLVLFAAPGGLVSTVNGARDSVLRIVAQRRQIVVPSLFADYDPDALERRLVPLGEVLSGAGLSALDTTEGWIKPSVLYRGRGERVVDRLEGRVASREAAAYGAAARRADDRILVPSAPEADS